MKTVNYAFTLCATSHWVPSWLSILCPLDNYHFLRLNEKLLPLAPFISICFFRCIMALFQTKKKMNDCSKQSKPMTLAGLTYPGYPWILNTPLWHDFFSCILAPRPLFSYPLADRSLIGSFWVFWFTSVELLRMWSGPLFTRFVLIFEDMGIEGLQSDSPSISSSNNGRRFVISAHNKLSSSMSI